MAKLPHDRKEKTSLIGNYDEHVSISLEDSEDPIHTNNSRNFDLQQFRPLLFTIASTVVLTAWLAAIAYGAIELTVLVQNSNSTIPTNSNLPIPTKSSGPYRCNNPLRCLSLNATHSFSFVHISKCAGASWIDDLKVLLPNFYPQSNAGAEYSVKWQKKEYPAEYQLISLKSPRHHVFSLFAECKYDAWGIKVTKGEDFPRTGNTTAYDVADFDVWLDKFINTKTAQPRDGDLHKCYHPSNYQSRHLTSTSKSAHFPTEGVLEPPYDVANETLYKEYWVAITEFYHESKCLLFHRLGETAPPEARSYLDELCQCPRPVNKNEHKIVHHALGHRSSMRDLPPDILEKIAILTRVDVPIYKDALVDFMSEIKWLESDLGLNRRVLCDDVLEKFEPELAYLNLSVTDLYNY